MIDPSHANQLTSVSSSAASARLSAVPSEEVNGVADQFSFSQYLADLQAFSSAHNVEQLPLASLQTPVGLNEFQRLTVLQGGYGLSSSSYTLPSLVVYPQLDIDAVYSKLAQDLIEGNVALREASKSFSSETRSLPAALTASLIEQADPPAAFLLPNPGAEFGRGEGQQHSIDVPVGQRGWDQSLSGRVLWLFNRNLQGAKLQLNPPHLGPLEVRISLEKEQASVSFTTPHPLVREALESAIPRLREMLGDSGLNLANVDVFQQNLAQQNYTNSYPSPQPNEMLETSLAPNSEESLPDGERMISVGIGLVNYFV